MKRFNNILYVVEASVPHKSAMERAVSLAENSQANLTVIDTVPKVTSGITMPAGRLTTAELQSAMVNNSLKDLEVLVAPYKHRIPIQIGVLVGTAFLEIIRAVLRENFDLIIKAAEKPNFLNQLFGSKDMHLLRKCPCPLWLTRPDEETKYSSIMAAVDFNIDAPDMPDQNPNQTILEIASALAVSELSELHFIHAWDAPGEMTVRTWSDNPDSDSRTYIEGERSRHEIALNRFRDQLRNHLGAEAYDYLSPQFHLKRGAPSNVIPETAKQLQADLVVMGTVSRTGISGFIIGNTAESILEKLQCSVLAVKPDDFVSPVKLSD
jgi:universal stress protein E